MKYLLLSIFFTILCNCVIAQVPAYVDTNGLLAWYPLDGNLTNVYHGPANNGVGYGTIAYDIDRAGLANHCYIGNTLNGIDIPANNFPVGNAARSVSVFYKSTFPYPTGVHQLIAWGNNTVTGQKFGIILTDSSVAVEYTNGSVYKKVTPDDQWHNVTVTYPAGGAGSSSIKLYFDGVLSTTITEAPIATLATAASPTHCIGTLFYTTNQYSWSGKIDDVGIWNRELTACEVQALSSGVTAVPPITGTLSTCIGQTTTLGNAATGGIWSSSNGSVATVGVSSGVVNGVAAGTATITYTSGGCTASAVVTVNAYPDPGTIIGFPVLCVNVGTRLNETESGGKWSSGNNALAIIDSSTGVINTISKGTVVMSYTVKVGVCASVAVYTVTVVDPAFTVNKTVGNIKCYGNENGSVTLSINGGKPPFRTRWSTGDTALTLSNLKAGDYIFTVKEDSSQCSVKDTIKMINPDSLVVSVDTSFVSCDIRYGKLKAAASGGISPYQYQWSNVSGYLAGTNEIDSLYPSQYNVVVTDANGCIDSGTSYVFDSCAHVGACDAISPNGDGLNDTWIVGGIERYPGNSVQIFDKWGNMVYEQTNYKNDWNGKGKNDATLPDGNYYYLVKLNAPYLNGADNVLRGVLLIMR